MLAQHDNYFGRGLAARTDKGLRECVPMLKGERMRFSSSPRANCWYDAVVKAFMPGTMRELAGRKAVASRNAKTMGFTG